MELRAPGIRQHHPIIAAIASVVAITALVLALGIWREPDAYPLFLLAIAFSAWYGGLKPGLLALGLSAVAKVFFVLPPRYSFAIDLEGALDLALFTVVALLMGSLYAVSRREQEAAHREREKAEAASAAKGQFLAMLSHELRTPLTPVLLTAGDLETDARLPEDLRAEVQLIRRNVEVEVRLIDDLLDIVRLSKGKMALQFQVTDTHELIAAAAEMCRDDLRRKQLQLLLDLAATEHRVWADPVRLQQIVWNLLRNAIKFTPEQGRITVRTANENPLAGQRMTAAAQGSDRDAGPGAATSWLRIEVQDTGIGMEPDRLGCVFQAFEQGGGEIPQRFGGLGLGLTICRALAEAHGGAIGIDSPGRDLGTTVHVRLPAAAVEVLAAPRAPRTWAPVTGGDLPVRSDGAPAPDQPPSQSILLVEDHKDTARVMARLLRKMGHRVAVAHSVEEAVQCAATEAFDLVISDLGLPDGHGTDLMRRLRAQFDVRGVALTGHGTEQDVWRSIDAGFDAHLTKPIQPTDLEAVVRRVASLTPATSGASAGAGRHPRSAALPPASGG